MTWIDLAGAVNARDLGGLPTADGRAIRPGALLRSDNLQDLTEADVSALLARGLGTVLDLRTSAEVELTGAGPLHSAGVRHVHLDLIPHGFAGRAEIERAVPDESAGPHAMDHVYVDYVRDAPQGIAEGLRVLADPGSDGVLVHCAAGKDRTGVFVALALSLVGVPRDAVVADYVRTDERIEAVRERLIATPLYSEVMRARSLEAIRPHAGNMERFLDRIDREYGGVHSFALAVGVDDQTVARLTRRLLDTH